MIRNFGKVRIVNVVDRMMEGRVMKKLLERKSENVEISIAFDPIKWGAWKTYKKALEVDDDSKYLILMEDDISFPVDVLQKIDCVLESAPQDSWIFFYVPTNSNTIEAWDTGKHCMKSIHKFWPQLTAVPKAHRLNMLRTINDIWPEESLSGDGRIKKYLDYNKCTAYTIIPSICQHLGTWRSSLGYNGKCGDFIRNSFCYDPSFDAFSVDWKSEFENPHICKSGRGFIGFDGWKLGDPVENYNLVTGKKNDKSK